MTAATTAHSVVEPSRTTKGVAGALVILYALITMIPLVWIGLTSIKSPTDSISYPPKLMFTPSLEGYCNLFTTRSRQTPEYIQSLGPASGLCDDIAHGIRIADIRREIEDFGPQVLKIPDCRDRAPDWVVRVKPRIGIPFRACRQTGTANQYQLGAPVESQPMRHLKRKLAKTAG